VRQAYRSFVENIPFYGFAALCIDHTEVQALIGRVSDRRVVTYGMNPQADIRALNLRSDPLGSVFDIAILERKREQARTLRNVRLPMLGEHNVQNSLAAVAVAREMEFGDDIIRAALADFKGVKRRFTRTGVVEGVTVIDDYGHHPVEIAAVLRSARAAYHKRIVAVVQPHRYTRLRDLFEDFCACFNDADIVIVADIYAAGETPIAGFDRDALVGGLRAHGHKHVLSLDSSAALPAMLDPLVEPGDLVVFLGAGDITHWAHALPGALAEHRRRRPPADTKRRNVARKTR
jgi:UDP-N-acetylmuramate--alanine ligase